MLADTKIIAEAWDAAGLYQIGYFPGYRWAEWNGRYRDDVRRFVKGEPRAGRRAWPRGSPAASDLYQASGHLPINSVNFITCHDGFTLNDLVSYNEKHNDANGEGNRDGATTTTAGTAASRGRPTIPASRRSASARSRTSPRSCCSRRASRCSLAGDEVRRTQHGNNNAYCQDNDDQLVRLDAGQEARGSCSASSSR